jgi:hypothetical protein
VYRLVVFVAAAAMLLPNQGHTQTKRQLLRGLSKIDLLVEELGSRAKDCGLTEAAVRAAIMYPLSAANIQVDPAVNSDATLYVNIGTIYLKADQTCFSSLRIEAYTIQKIALEFSGDEKWVEVRLWHSGGIASSHPSQHARQMTDYAEETVKKFITDWNLDNKP